ncbi:MAG: ABC transporter ATP-binding protein [Gammaproteobacteria bacterium]
MSVMQQELLRVAGLKTVFRTAAGTAAAVDGVSYTLRERETLAVVGESGSGKSVSALTVMGLIPNPPGEVLAGEVWYRGRDLLSLPEKALEKVRGAEISMIFQEPMSSLNPVLTIERQLTETVMHHERVNAADARLRAIEMLELVHIPEPERRVNQYPHQLSGGMLQRVMIAMALACGPRVLIADEPTTALDVTIQAQILALMADLQERFGTAILLITHDLGVVAETADRVAVMYAGRIVEQASVFDVFERPRHPYTRGLLNAIPHLDDLQGEHHRERLDEIPGIVPPLTRLPPGCRFAPRCPHAHGRCQQEYPPFQQKAEQHWVACWHADALADES